MSISIFNVVFSMKMGIQKNEEWIRAFSEMTIVVLKENSKLEEGSR